jgi:hypothetical protein
VLLVLAVWLTIESLAALVRTRRTGPLDSLEVTYPGAD